MQERSPLALVLAVALIVGVAMPLPTIANAAQWVEDQLRLLEGDRAFRRP